MFQLVFDELPCASVAIQVTRLVAATAVTVKWVVPEDVANQGYGTAIIRGAGHGVGHQSVAPLHHALVLNIPFHRRTQKSASTNSTVNEQVDVARLVLHRALNGLVIEVCGTQ